MFAAMVAKDSLVFPSPFFSRYRGSWNRVLTLILQVQIRLLALSLLYTLLVGLVGATTVRLGPRSFCFLSVSEAEKHGGRRPSISHEGPPVSISATSFTHQAEKTVKYVVVFSESSI